MNLSAKCAKNIISFLEQHVGQNNPMMTQTNLGYTAAAIQSSMVSQNTPTAFQYQTAAGTISNEFKIKWLQRGVRGGGSDTETCDTDTKTYQETTFAVTKYYQKGFSIDETSMQAFCDFDVAKDNFYGAQIPHFLFTTILSEMDSIRQELNYQLLTIQASKIGVNAETGDNLAKNVPIIVTTPGANEGALVAAGMAEVGNDFGFANQQRDVPLIVHGSLMNKARLVSKYGCCNLNGTNVSQLMNDGYLFYPDNQIDTVLGADKFLVIAPGSVKLVTYNKFVGGFGGQKESGSFKTIIPDSVFPDLKYDLTVFYKDCANGGDSNGEYHVIIGLHYDLFSIPDTAYAITDPLSGVNGTFLYKAVGV